VTLPAATTAETQLEKEDMSIFKCREPVSAAALQLQKLLTTAGAQKPQQLAAASAAAGSESWD
jgi:hypothetical protein